MSEEQLKAFWEAIQADAGLQQKLQDVTEPDAVAAIMEEAGFHFSAELVKEAKQQLLEEGSSWYQYIYMVGVD